MTAVEFHPPVANFTVQNTEFYNNSADRFWRRDLDPLWLSQYMENSTLWGNSAGYVGGGMVVDEDGVAEHRGEAHVFNNVTISGNSAVDFGGGLVTFLQVTMDHSTLAENVAPGTGADLYMFENQAGSWLFSQPDQQYDYFQHLCYRCDLLDPIR